MTEDLKEFQEYNQPIRRIYLVLGRSEFVCGIFTFKCNYEGIETLLPKIRYWLSI